METIFQKVKIKYLIEKNLFFFTKEKFLLKKSIMNNLKEETGLWFWPAFLIIVIIHYTSLYPKTKFNFSISMSLKVENLIYALNFKWFVFFLIFTCLIHTIKNEKTSINFFEMKETLINWKEKWNLLLELQQDGIYL